MYHSLRRAGLLGGPAGHIVPLGLFARMLMRRGVHNSDLSNLGWHHVDIDRGEARPRSTASDRQISQSDIRRGTAAKVHITHLLCDLKAGTGLAICLSGRFAANAAWLLAATLAHNLLRWTASLGLGSRDQQTVAKTLRRTLLMPPGRLTCSAAGWPWPTRSPWRSRGCSSGWRWR